MVLDTYGIIWVWGSNEDWQLGIIGSSYLLSAVQIRGIPTVRAIATGWDSSTAVTTQNRVLAWGDRIYPTPAEIPNLHDVLSVYVGGNAAATAGIFTIQMDGSVYRWQPKPRIQKNDQSALHNGILSRFPSDSSVPFKLETPNKDNPADR
jgi:alpha-tubulin suppressor-like RCC1 family protein